MRKAYIMNKNDFILIGILFIMCISSILIFQSCSSAGNCVVIKQDGAVYGSFSLSEDKVIRIPDTGNDYNVVTIKDSSVYVSDADCPDMICVDHKSIHKTGESIICLPHRLSITISVSGTQASGNSANDRIDGISH